MLCVWECHDTCTVHVVHMWHVMMHVRIVNTADQQDFPDCGAQGQHWQVEGPVHRRLMGNKVTM